MTRPTSLLVVLLVGSLSACASGGATDPDDPYAADIDGGGDDGGGGQVNTNHDAGSSSGNSGSSSGMAGSQLRHREQLLGRHGFQLRRMGIVLGRQLGIELGRVVFVVGVRLELRRLELVVRRGLVELRLRLVVGLLQLQQRRRGHLRSAERQRQLHGVHHGEQALPEQRLLRRVLLRHCHQRLPLGQLLPVTAS